MNDCILESFAITIDDNVCLENVSFEQAVESCFPNATIQVYIPGSGWQDIYTNDSLSDSDYIEFTNTIPF